MKLYVKYILAGVLCSPWLFADVIDLKDGTRVEGLILAENDDSLEIEVGQNESGTIRRVLIIHSSEVKSWMADKEGRIQRGKGDEVERLDGKAYVEKMMDAAEEEIGKGHYNKGIEQFNAAADLAILNLDDKEPAQQLESLELRELALRLQLAALEGKSESLEKRAKGLEDEVKARRKRLDREIEEYKEDKEDLADERNEQNIQLGQRHKQSDLVQREEELLQRQNILLQQEAEVTKMLNEYDSEQLKTQTQIKLTKERVEEAENKSRLAERNLRRR
ncbi:hypothetical protein P3T73_13295 [Kiritimatiellota bacterium B12222]|nr:hypothetical protein P3T73_13295 [Kiritimatiellota bacterium B12222]